jgi:hypothetical protein
MFVCNSYFRSIVDREKGGSGVGEMALLSAECFEAPKK